MDNVKTHEKIIIGKPYITEIEGDKVRLCSDIQKDGQMRTLYYEVDKKYAEYLCYDRSDAFVLGLLHSAMNEEKDIVCEVGVTEQLLFQLRHFYISVISQNMPDLQCISISAEAITDPIISQNAVGTGNSGGIDSFYTALKYGEENGSYKLTHLLFNNISTEDNNDDRIREWFEKEKTEKEKIAEELGLESVFVYSNLYSFYNEQFIYNYYYGAQYASAPYALAKLFSVYYYSSSYSISDFTVDHKEMSDGSNFDLLALDCFSTNQLRIYSTGGDVDRLEKSIYIANNPIVQRHLQVCAVEQNKDFYAQKNTVLSKLNCGKCRKCRRTITALYALDILDKYEGIFDLSFFKENKGKFMAQQLSSDHPEFTLELKKMLKRTNKYAPNTNFWIFMYSIRYFLARNKKLVKVYHTLTNKK